MYLRTPVIIGKLLGKIDLLSGRSDEIVTS